MALAPIATQWLDEGHDTATAWSLAAGAVTAPVAASAVTTGPAIMMAVTSPAAARANRHRLATPLARFIAQPSAFFRPPPYRTALQPWFPEEPMCL